MSSPKVNGKKSIHEKIKGIKETPPKNGAFKEQHQIPVRFGTPGFPSPLDRLRLNHSRTRIVSGPESSCGLYNDFDEILHELDHNASSDTRKNRSFDYNQSFPKSRHNKFFEEVRLENCRVYRNARKFLNTTVETSQVEVGSYPHLKNKDTSSSHKALELSFNEHSFSFSSLGYKGSLQSKNVSVNHSLFTNVDDRSLEWKGRRDFGGQTLAANDSMLTSTVVNPNKLVLSLDEKGNILTFNDMAFQLLEYPPDKLSGMNFYHDILIHKKGCEDRTDDNGLEALGEVELCLNEKNQGGVLICGEVVDLITMNGNQLSMSLWVKEVFLPCGNANDNNSSQNKLNSRKMAILESVEQTVGTISISQKGDIIEVDKNAKKIFQLKSDLSKETISITQLIPNFETNHLNDVSYKKKLKSKLTGHTSDGIAFPLALSISRSDQHITESSDDSLSQGFIVTIWVYSNISGLMLVSKDGIMQTCNPTFIHLLLGYQASDIIGEKITSIIPAFYTDIELAETFYSNHDVLDEKEIIDSKENLECRDDCKNVLKDLENIRSHKKGKAKARLDFSQPIKDAVRSNTELNFDKENSFDNIHQQTDINAKSVGNALSEFDNKENKQTGRLTPEHDYGSSALKESKIITSTPFTNTAKHHKEIDFFSENSKCVKSGSSESNEFPQGSFFGYGRHKDGAEINIMYQVRISCLFSIRARLLSHHLVKIS